MRRRSPVWRRTCRIPDHFVTQRDLMEAAGIDRILFEQMRTAGIIPRNPPPWQWSGVPIWYRADLPKLVAAIQEELDRRQQVVRQIFTASTTPAQ